MSSVDLAREKRPLKSGVRHGLMRGWVVLIQGLLFIGTMAYALILPVPPETALVPLCMATLAMTLWIGWTLPFIQRDIFNLYSLFSLALVLFNAGRIFLEVIDYNPYGMLGRVFLENTWTQTVVLVLTSISGFHFGGLLSSGIGKRVYEPCPEQRGISFPSRPAAVVGGIILLIASVPFLVVTIHNIQVVMAEGYSGLFDREREYGLDAGWWGVLTNLARLALPALVFSFVGWKEKPKLQKGFLVLLFSYGILQLFLGRRSWGSMSLLSAIWLWHVVVHPISIKKFVVVGLLTLIFVFPTIKVFRSETGVNRLSIQRIRDAYSTVENPALEIISEMGRSMWCISYSLELVPYTRPFEYGRTYAYAATAVLPNLFWEIHPAAEHGNLARWLTMNIAQATWEQGGGLGYSCIAEAYVNFGWAGAPLAMFIIGYAMAWATRWGNTGDHLSKAVIAIIMAYVLFWARGDVTLFVRPIAWGALLPYFVIRNMQRGELRRQGLSKLQYRKSSDDIPKEPGATHG